jgi:hypothetical protein
MVDLSWLDRSDPVWWVQAIIGVVVLCVIAARFRSKYQKNPGVLSLLNDLAVRLPLLIACLAGAGLLMIVMIVKAYFASFWLALALTAAFVLFTEASLFHIRQADGKLR